MNDVQSLQDLAFHPLSFGLGLFAGAAVVALVLGLRVARLAGEKAALQARLDSERGTLGDHFKTLAQEALQSNTENFLTLAQERLRAANAQGAHDLDKRTLEIEKMVKPVEKHLERMNSLVEQIHGTDKALRGDLQNLHRETAKLAGVLRNPSAQGRWGEFVLETILEKANLIRGVHYSTQEQVEGGRRPDVIINLHDGFRIAIDSKAPINEFIARLDDDLTADESQAIQANMARAVRAHVKALGARAYQENVAGSDFVILFLPSEVIFSATLRADPDIVDYAAENHVVIASPTLIMSLLRVVGLSWRQVEMAKNAAEISALGAELHKRFAKFIDHFTKIGKSINGALSSYNDAVGSLDRSVLPAARRFTKLHSNNMLKIADVPGIENSVRQIIASNEGEAFDDDMTEEEPGAPERARHG